MLHCRAGEVLRFGATVALQHKTSGRFLTVLSSGAVVTSLTAFLGSLLQVVSIPTPDNFGDAVLEGDPVWFRVHPDVRSGEAPGPLAPGPLWSGGGKGAALAAAAPGGACSRMDALAAALGGGGADQAAAARDAAAAAAAAAAATGRRLVEGRRHTGKHWSWVLGSRLIHGSGATPHHASEAFKGAPGWQARQWSQQRRSGAVVAESGAGAEGGARAMRRTSSAMDLARAKSRLQLGTASAFLPPKIGLQVSCDTRH